MNQQRKSDHLAVNAACPPTNKKEEGENMSAAWMKLNCESRQLHQFLSCFSHLDLTCTTGTQSAALFEEEGLLIQPLRAEEFFLR